MVIQLNRAKNRKQEPMNSNVDSNPIAAWLTCLALQTNPPIKENNSRVQYNCERDEFVMFDELGLNEICRFVKQICQK